MSDFELDTNDFYTDEEVKDHLREDREEQERLESERDAFFDEDDPMFDDDDEDNESEEDYTQDALICLIANLKAKTNFKRIFMSFEKERAEAIALVEEALEDFDIDATRAEINSFVDAYTADTINDLELVDIAEAYRNFTSDE